MTSDPLLDTYPIAIPVSYAYTTTERPAPNGKIEFQITPLSTTKTVLTPYWLSFTTV